MTGHVLTPYNQIDDYGGGKEWKRFKQLQSLKNPKKSTLTSLTASALLESDHTHFSPRTQHSLSNWTGETCGFNLIEAVLTHIVRFEGPGAVLVFMTGWEDIQGLLEQLRSHPLLGQTQEVMLLGCHGSMASHEQVRGNLRP